MSRAPGRQRRFQTRALESSAQRMAANKMLAGKQGKWVDLAGIDQVVVCHLCRDVHVPEHGAVCRLRKA
jgi:hypothetical protein